MDAALRCWAAGGPHLARRYFAEVQVWREAGSAGYRRVVALLRIILQGVIEKAAQRRVARRLLPAARRNEILSPSRRPVPGPMRPVQERGGCLAFCSAGTGKGIKSGAAETHARQNGVNTWNGLPLLFLISSGSNNRDALKVSTPIPSESAPAALFCPCRRAPVHGGGSRISRLHRFRE